MKIINIDKIKQNKSYTLIETLLALTIVVLILGVLFTVVNVGLTAYRKSQEIIDISQTAQFILDTMYKEISSAYEFTTTDAGEIRFTAPYYGAEENAYRLHTIGYSLNGDTIERYYEPPDGVGSTEEFVEGISSLNYTYTDTDSDGDNDLVTIDIEIEDNNENTHSYTMSVYLR